VLGGSGAEFAIAPEEGMAVLHFPATTSQTGGYTDYNAYHEAEPAIDDKWIVQQFVYETNQWTSAETNLVSRSEPQWRRRVSALSRASRCSAGIAVDCARSGGA